MRPAGRFFRFLLMDIHNPTGATEVARLHAPRLDSLAGKKVAMLSDDMWQSHRILPLLKKNLEVRFPDVEVIPESEFPMGTGPMDREETADLIASQGIDAVIVGNAA